MCRSIFQAANRGAGAAEHNHKERSHGVGSGVPPVKESRNGLQERLAPLARERKKRNNHGDRQGESWERQRADSLKSGVGCHCNRAGTKAQQGTRAVPQERKEQ